MVGVAVGDGVSVAVAVGDGVNVAVAVGDGVRVAVAVGDGVNVSAAVGVGVSVAVAVGVGICAVDVGVKARTIVVGSGSGVRSPHAAMDMATAAPMTASAAERPRRFPAFRMTQPSASAMFNALLLCRNCTIRGRSIRQAPMLKCYESGRRASSAVFGARLSTWAVSSSPSR